MRVTKFLGEKIETKLTPLLRMFSLLPIPTRHYHLNPLSFLVGFLLVFRSTIAYNRFWHGRGHLNKLQNESMEFMRNVCMFASSEGGWVSEAR